MKRTKMEKGITLVSLITTVIVLCILAATAIGTIQRDGLISKSQDASDKYNQGLKEDEAFMQEGESILDEVLGGVGGGGSSGGAAPESVFLWKSNDRNSPDYGTVIGYTANIDNYPSLRFPDRCTKITVEFSDDMDEDTRKEMRSYTENIKEIELPETVVEIGYEAFCGYTFSSLKKINIPNSVTTIGESAFMNCYELTQIIIPNSVITIGESAFRNCYELTQITISNSVTSIGYRAFLSCLSITSLTFNGTISQWNAIELILGWDEGSHIEEVICTDGKVYVIGLASTIFDENGYDICNQVVETNTTAYDEYGNKIVVPAGFKIYVSNSTNYAMRVTEGIVIEDENGNQFVWVPVGKIYTDIDKTESLAKIITLGRYSSFTATDGVYTPTQTAENYATSITIGYCEEDTTSNHNSRYGNAIARDIGAFVTSATTNGGYYIGRFEAGNLNDILVCKYNQTVYNNITQTDASSVCQSMYADGYSSGTFSSDLINSYAWDTAIIFIQTFGTKSNSSSYENTGGRSDTSTKGPQTTGTNILDATGSVDEQLNIYDMAGNCYEWSTETSFSTQRLWRLSWWFFLHRWQHNERS